MTGITRDGITSGASSMASLCPSTAATRATPPPCDPTQETRRTYSPPTDCYGDADPGTRNIEH
jgi:hypothetical protein